MQAKPVAVTIRGEVFAGTTSAQPIGLVRGDVQQQFVDGPSPVPAKPSGTERIQVFSGTFAGAQNLEQPQGDGVVADN